MLFTIAFRNILRNKRRSLMTLLAIAVGGIALVLFGEFVAFVKVGLETNAVQNVGHLTVYRTGYFDYGAGNPAAFGIGNYEQVARAIAADPEIEPTLNLVTPTVSLTGIAGNFDIDASKTFLGTGYVPSDRDRMLRWDEHGVSRHRVFGDSGSAMATRRAAWSASGWRASSGSARSSRSRTARLGRASPRRRRRRRRLPISPHSRRKAMPPPICTATRHASICSPQRRAARRT